MARNNLTDKELFAKALQEALDEKMQKEVEEFENMDLTENISFSRRHKIRMTRLFRERVGGTFLPFPEVDNPLERLRSKIVVKFSKK